MFQTFTRFNASVSGRLAFILTLLTPLAAAAQSFDGFYVGIDAARQSTIAGALVAGIDTLKQSTRNVASLNAGYRMELPGGFVAGVELGYGVTDGDLTLNDAVNRLTIDYKNSTQFSYGAQAGYAFGADNATLVFAYLSETKRSFDVTIRGPLGVGSQNDKQGLLRYGLGVEQRLAGPISVRAMVGSSRAGFGDRRTNIDPQSKVDFGLGAVWQF
ncbi:MAG: outer membrane beta-barrel protein [Rhodospirillaceae bacterium]|nr:outer membrane beta-barrel protein [Rhodospirillaceae bacterium]